MPPASAPQVPASPSNDSLAKWSPVLWGFGIVSTAWATAGAVDLATRRQLDIAVYLLGGRNLVDGRLYQVALPQLPHLPFTYPPFAALVFAPLSALPQRGAQVIWALINVVALFALVALALRAAHPGLGRRRLLMWSLVLMQPAYLSNPSTSPSASARSTSCWRPWCWAT